MWSHYDWAPKSLSLSLCPKCNSILWAKQNIIFLSTPNVKFTLCKALNFSGGQNILILIYVPHLTTEWSHRLNMDLALQSLFGLLCTVQLYSFGGFIKGILRGVRCTKSLRVLFLHRRPSSWTTLVLNSRAVFIFNEPAYWLRPRNSPPPPAFGLIIRGRYWSAKIDDISLLPPAWN